VLNRAVADTVAKSQIVKATQILTGLIIITPVLYPGIVPSFHIIRCFLPNCSVASQRWNSEFLLAHDYQQLPTDNFLESSQAPRKRQQYVLSTPFYPGGSLAQRKQEKQRESDNPFPFLLPSRKQTTIISRLAPFRNENDSTYMSRRSRD